jgi:hypothetical protein
MIKQPPIVSCVFPGILLCTLLVGAALPAPAQRIRPGNPVDLEQLRSKLEEAIGQDFEVVKGELKGRSNASGGGTYWLAHLRPKHAGHFKLTYRYNYNDPHYSHVERQFSLNVGWKGCRRGVPSYGSYHRFCLGDTIIFPIAIYNFTEHEFTLTSTGHTPEQDAVWEKVSTGPPDESLEHLRVNNPIAEQMRYVGSNSQKLLHRNGGYTLESYAVFEAQRPGRFNVALSAAFTDLPSAVLSSVGTSNGTPIIIVARETPVTLLASRHEVRGYSMGYDGRERVSSTSGDSFMTDLTILQPGDRISLKYYTTIRSARYERSERAAQDAPDVVPSPLISKLPFSLQAENNFTEWLMDYLPR